MLDSVKPIGTEEDVKPIGTEEDMSFAAVEECDSFVTARECASGEEVLFKREVNAWEHDADHFAGCLK